jgi:hypothetical protein
MDYRGLFAVAITHPPWLPSMESVLAFLFIFFQKERKGTSRRDKGGKTFRGSLV